MTHFVAHYGLWVVFGVVFLEVAGLPFIPGETALIAAAALASQGHGSIVAIICLAIAAAVSGALLAYAIGHRWGRELLQRWPWFERISHRGVERSQDFFDRHGSKAVFLGRFVPVLRATLGWMAGIGRMRFGSFLLWNVAGAVAWGCLIGLGAYYLGKTVIDAVERDLGIGVAAIAGILLLLGGIHLLRRRIGRETRCRPAPRCGCRCRVRRWKLGRCDRPGHRAAIGAAAALLARRRGGLREPRGRFDRGEP